MLAQAFKTFLSGTFLAAGAVGAVAPALQHRLTAMLASEHVLKIDAAVQIVFPFAVGLAWAAYSARRTRTSKAA